MANPLKLSNYRVYTSTVSPTKNLPYAHLDGELHIVLVFARDYDGYGNNTSGNFEAYYDRAWTAKLISDIRKNANTSVKFFLSIGGRDSRFPFDLDPKEESTWTWIKNAVDSLKKIIDDLKLDGIDVYYEHIKPNSEGVFVKVISNVISALKNEEKAISLASITVSAPLKDIYDELFRSGLFDYVVYQTHTETSLVYDFKALEFVLSGLPYPKNITFAGYSNDPADWAEVPPPIFEGVIPWIIEQGFFGLSKWIVPTCDPNPGEA